MKKINIVFLLSLLLCMSCDNILDKGPLDTFANSNFWTSEQNVERYANAFYQRFTGYGNGNGYGNFYFNTLNDDQAGTTFSNWTFLTVPATNANWQNGWIEIRRANIMLEKIPGIEAMTEEEKNHWMGVGYLMRAWEYFKLVRMYGDLTWVDKSLDITDEGYLYGARVSRDIIMDNILKDLEFACENIRDNGSKITFSRDLAYAMTAEICLYEGTFRKYRKAEDKQAAPDLEGAKKFLTEAKKAASRIMVKSKYSLNGSYQGNYNSTSLSNNPEMIFYKAYRQDIFSHSTIAYISSSTPIHGMTKSAFEAYLFRDGKPLALTTLDKTDIPVMETREDGRNYFSIKHMLDVRDKRLSQTTDNAVFHNGRVFRRFVNDMGISTSTGYGVSKFDNGDLTNAYRDQTSKNYTDAPLYWLSVIYLQYAEAAAELESLGGEAMTQADLDVTINLLKARADLPPLSKTVGFSDPANNHGVSDLIWEIRRERRCELMFDNNERYWDLVRWHQLDKLDSTKYPDILTGANLSTDPDIDPSEVSLKNGYMDASGNNTRVFDNKYYLFPIPSGQLTLNKELGQNYGW